MGKKIGVFFIIKKLTGQEKFYFFNIMVEPKRSSVHSEPENMYCVNKFY